MNIRQNLAAVMKILDHTSNIYDAERIQEIEGERLPKLTMKNRQAYESKHFQRLEGK
jgi:hypothetical protein